MVTTGVDLTGIVGLEFVTLRVFVKVGLIDFVLIILLQLNFNNKKFKAIKLRTMMVKVLILVGFWAHVINLILYKSTNL